LKSQTAAMYPDLVPNRPLHTHPPIDTSRLPLGPARREAELDAKLDSYERRQRDLNSRALVPVPQPVSQPRPKGPDETGTSVYKDRAGHYIVVSPTKHKGGTIDPYNEALGSGNP
jgi:hypothetical protein